MNRNVTTVWWAVGLVALCANACSTSNGTPPVESGTSAAGLYYEVSGAGDAVVLIHAFSLDRRMWDEQVEVLRPKYRVVRFDLRGHGNSAAISESFTAHDDLLSVLDAVGANRAALVGLSSGAQIAVDFALAYPERVTSMILAGPGLTGYVPQESFEWMTPTIQAIQAGDVERAMTLWSETRLMAIPQNAAADSVMRRLAQENGDIWLASPTAQQQLDPPAIARLADIGAPVLVVVGESDLGDMHRVADTLVTCIAGARRLTIDNAGHLVTLAASQTFNDAMIDFLARPSNTTTNPSPCAGG